MSIATEIARIQTDKIAIREKLVELGLATSTATLDACATAIDGIANKGAVNAQVKEGETYTIPAGYHNGSGVVAGVKGGGNYGLQEKSVTPTKQQQSVTADSGYYGLSGVTVAAIPEAYQNVSATTAAAGDVLTGKVFVTKDGTVTTGTMANNGAVNKTLDITSQVYSVPAGYHNGSGKVQVSLMNTSTVTPTKSKQTITPSTGKLLSTVEVEAIPAAYQDVTGVTAAAADVLTGKKIVSSSGAVVNGSMANNGAIAATIDGLTTMSATVPVGYHNGSGKVTLTNDIENALKEI